MQINLLLRRRRRRRRLHKYNSNTSSQSPDRKEEIMSSSGGGGITVIKTRNARRRRRRTMEMRRLKYTFQTMMNMITIKEEEEEEEVDHHQKKKEEETETEHVPSYGSVSVIGRRREMEDAVREEVRFVERGGERYDFYGVYDGHGGARVAEACGERLHRMLAEEISDGGEEEEGIDWERAMEGCFEKMDEEVNRAGVAEEMVGSTAVVAVVGRDVVVVANCGDSRAVLCRSGVAVPLSSDHKPDRADELARVEAAGGRVFNWDGHRVGGVLATSRSIGDQYLKPYVISKPEVTVNKLSDGDEFVILASDGLWDVISNDVACRVVRRCLLHHINSQLSSTATTARPNHRATEAAALLARLAIARGSRDNISVIVVELTPQYLGYDTK